MIEELDFQHHNTNKHIAFGSVIGLVYGCWPSSRTRDVVLLMFEILIRSYEDDFMVSISARICIFLAHLRFQGCVQHQPFSQDIMPFWRDGWHLFSTFVYLLSKVKYPRDKVGFSTTFSESAT